MSWWAPWRKDEVRESGGDFADAVVRLIEARASGSAADASSTAAVECASGSLSRAFQRAEVVAEPWVQEAVTPTVLAQIGRDLVRAGDSLHAIRMSRDGTMTLIPCSSWHWEGSHDPATWTVRATAYGPSTSTTWNLPAAGVVFVSWGSTPGQPYIGTGPTSWAHTTTRLAAATERQLADEAGGPIAQILPYPRGPDNPDDDTDSLGGLLADIAGARGGALLTETTAAGLGEGRQAAPPTDWIARRLGAQPPAELVKLAQDSFERTLAATGTPMALYSNADGTSQREALRRWHQNLVLPLARSLEHELSRKLETDVKITFDTYGMDMVSRAQVVAKLTGAGVALPVALQAVGLADAE